MPSNYESVYKEEFIGVIGLNIAKKIYNYIFWSKILHISSKFRIECLFLDDVGPITHQSRVGKLPFRAFRALFSVCLITQKGTGDFNRQHGDRHIFFMICIYWMQKSVWKRYLKRKCLHPLLHESFNTCQYQS